MDKNVITILVVIVALILIWFLFSSFSKAPSGSTYQYTGNLVSANPLAGYTTATYTIVDNAGHQMYTLTYTPADYVPTPTRKADLNSLPVSKTISPSDYKAFITKYPDAKAQGNVLADYATFNG